LPTKALYTPLPSPPLPSPPHPSYTQRNKNNLNRLEKNYSILSN
jgi:hypothetical protein